MSLVAVRPDRLLFATELPEKVNTVYLLWTPRSVVLQLLHAVRLTCAPVKSLT